MSYTITLVEEHYSSNYTFNIYKMVQEAFETIKEEKCKEWHHDWYDPLTDCVFDGARDYLVDLITELKSNPEKYKKLQPKIDPETGERWGSYDGCIKWLEQILVHWKDGYRLEIEK